MGRRARRFVYATVAAVAVGLTLALPSVAKSGSSPPTLALVSTDKLSVVRKPGSIEAQATIFVVNEGTKKAALQGVALRGFAKPIDVRAGHATAPGQPPKVEIPGGDAARLMLTFIGLRNLKTKVKGLVVITGGAKPLTRTVEITPKLKPARNWAHDIPLYSLGVGAALALISVVWILVVTRGLGRLFNPAPGPKWSLSSWATNLTAAGAVLGTTLASVTLPDVPAQIDKDTLVTLNIFFGVLLVAGPFAFQGLRRPSSSPLDPADNGLWSSNGMLLVAACLTYAAVAGEIATLGLLFWEILSGGTWGAVAKWLTVAAEAVAVWYFVWTIPRVAAADWPTLQKVAGKQAATADRQRMSEFARIIHREFRPRRLALLDEAAFLWDDERRELTEQLEDPDVGRRDHARRKLQALREPTDELIGEDAERPAAASNTFRTWALP